MGLQQSWPGPRPLDGRLKEISEAAAYTLMRAHPNASIEHRDGARIVVVPMYDINTDRSWVEERKIIEAAETFQGIVPVLNIRTGAKFSPGGDVKTGPLGQLYRILGYSPPPKEDGKD